MANRIINVLTYVVKWMQGRKYEVTKKSAGLLFPIHSRMANTINLNCIADRSELAYPRRKHELYSSELNHCG